VRAVPHVHGSDLLGENSLRNLRLHTTRRCEN
jgi:hypothetical protein